MLWLRPPSASGPLEEPLECVELHEPIHAFALRWPVALDVAAGCWRVTGETSSGWHVGDVVENTSSSLEGYVVPTGGAPSLRVEARLQLTDGRLIAGTGEYRARVGSSDALSGERLAERPIVLFRGYATARGGPLTPDLHVDATNLLAAADVGHEAPGAAWLDRRTEGLVLSVAVRDYTGDGLRTFEVAIDETPGVEPRLSTPGRAGPNVVVVSGARVVVVTVDAGSPTVSPSIATQTFVLDSVPDAIGVWNGLLLGIVSSELRAWTLDGDPRPASVHDVTAIVPGSTSPRLIAGGMVGMPELDASGSVIIAPAYSVDPALGPPLAAGLDALIGENGFQRPPLHGGPTTVLSAPRFGGRVVSAVVDDYLSAWRFAVQTADGTYQIWRTEPSFEGCD